MLRGLASGIAAAARAPKHSAGEVLLLGGVPLAGDQHSEALARVGHKACSQRVRSGGMKDRQTREEQRMQWPAPPAGRRA